jgi:hypothetical protein
MLDNPVNTTGASAPQSLSELIQTYPHCAVQRFHVYLGDVAEKADYGRSHSPPLHLEQDGDDERRKVRRLLKGAVASFMKDIEKECETFGYSPDLKNEIYQYLTIGSIAKLVAIDKKFADVLPDTPEHADLEICHKNVMRIIRYSLGALPKDIEFNGRVLRMAARVHDEDQPAHVPTEANKEALLFLLIASRTPEAILREKPQIDILRALLETIDADLSQKLERAPQKTDEKKEQYYNRYRLAQELSEKFFPDLLGLKRLAANSLVTRAPTRAAGCDCC